MGRRQSWLATKQGQEHTLLSRLNVTKGGKADGIDPGLRSIAVNDWYVVMGDGHNFMGRVPEEAAVDLSDDDVVFFTADDTPMESRVAVFQNGKLAWALNCNCTDAVLEGDVPKFASDMVAEQRDVCAEDEDELMYEVAHFVAEELVGFHHEADWGDAFDELVEE